MRSWAISGMPVAGERKRASRIGGVIDPLQSDAIIGLLGAMRDLDEVAGAGGGFGFTEFADVAEVRQSASNTI